MTHLGTAPSVATGHRHALARAVVTGVGIVAPNGRNAEEYWSAVLRGESGIARITRFDPSRYSVQLAAQADIDAPARLSSRLLPQTDTMTRLALVAAEEALRDAGVDSRQTSGYAAGVVTAASAGGSSFVQHELEAPGSTRSTPARSPSVTTCGAPEARWWPTRPVAWTPSPGLAVSCATGPRSCSQEG